jgi:hypothetical protein
VLLLLLGCHVKTVLPLAQHPPPLFVEDAQRRWEEHFGGRDGAIRPTAGTGQPQALPQQIVVGVVVVGMAQKGRASGEAATGGGGGVNALHKPRRR